MVGFKFIRKKPTKNPVTYAKNLTKRVNPRDLHSWKHRVRKRRRIRDQWK